MTTRFNAKPQGGINTGYNSSLIADDVNVQQCGVEDVDRAVFHLFDTEIPLYVNDKKVPVIFATGERWAQIKKHKDIRDKNGSLILPLVVVGRQSVKQTKSGDITGRGINQQTGELVIKRRLSQQDRAYQNVRNKIFLKSQNNVASSTSSELRTREINYGVTTPEITDGVFINNDLSENVWETIVVPAPQFFTAEYEVFYWSQYTSQMTAMFDATLAAMLPQGNSFVVKNPEKPVYWFVASVSEDFKQDNNFSDISDGERLIKTSFSLTVPGYVFATRVQGAPSPVRKYVSNPKIEFAVTDSDDVATPLTDVMNPYIGTDDPTLPLGIDIPDRLTHNVRDTGLQRSQYGSGVSQNDPALHSYVRGEQPKTYDKIPVVCGDGVVRYRYTRKRQGESTVSAADLSLDEISISSKS